MSEYLVDSQDLTSVANAIRTKGETQAQLTFPSGFISAISNISTGIPQALLDNNGTRTYFGDLFRSCSNLVDAPMLDTKNANNTGYMFCDCYSLVNIPDYDLRKVTSAHSMFLNCRYLITLRALDMPLCANMGQMFAGCSRLKTITSITTDKVTTDSSFLNTFRSCSALEDITIVGNISAAISFANSSKLTNNSLMNIANALNFSVTGKTITLHATSKTNCNNILGYNNGGTFELSGSGTQMSLTDFILNVKGWSIA